MKIRCSIYDIRFIIRYPAPVPILVFLRSKVWVCGRPLAGIVGSNPARSMDYVCYECCMLWGRGLSDGLIPCPEESCGLTFIECGQVQQWPATLTLVEEVRLSKKELVFIVIIHWCCHNCWSSLFRWFRSYRMWPCSYVSDPQSFKILWCPHFQGKQTSWTVCTRGWDHSLFRCHKPVTQYTPLLVYFSVSSHKLSCLVCFLFPFPYLYIIHVLISLHPCFPLFSFPKHVKI